VAVGHPLLANPRSGRNRLALQRNRAKPPNIGWAVPDIADAEESAALLSDQLVATCTASKGPLDELFTGQHQFPAARSLDDCSRIMKAVEERDRAQSQRCEILYPADCL